MNGTNDLPYLNDEMLDLLVATLDDIERTRIIQENRLRALTRNASDVDDKMRGFGLTDADPVVVMMRAQVEVLHAEEMNVEKMLRQRMRRHPLYPWIHSQIGLGDKRMARLLGVIGDPYMHPGTLLKDGTWRRPPGPRSPRELRALCGIRGDDPTRLARGHKVNWSPQAKMRLHLVSTDCVIQTRSPYRPIYDAGRQRYAEAVHVTPCAQCGTKGKPAQPGTPWRPGHQHAGALRLVKEAILMDLWREARRLHTDLKEIKSLRANVSRVILTADRSTCRSLV